MSPKQRVRPGTPAHIFLQAMSATAMSAMLPMSSEFGPSTRLADRHRRPFNPLSTLFDES